MLIFENSQNLETNVLRFKKKSGVKVLSFEFENSKSSTWVFEIFRLRRNLAKGVLTEEGFRLNTVVYTFSWWVNHSSSFGFPKFTLPP